MYRLIALIVVQTIYFSLVPVPELKAFLGISIGFIAVVILGDILFPTQFSWFNTGK